MRWADPPQRGAWRCSWLALLLLQLPTAGGILDRSHAIPMRDRAPDAVRSPEVHGYSNSTLMSKPWHLRFAMAQLGEQVKREIELELDSSQALREKNKLTLAILEFSLLGICGIDRCYMGQTCLGILKGLTLGGLLVWFVIDWLVIIIVNFTFCRDFQVLGYRAQFTGGVWAAFGLSLGLALLVGSVFVHSHFFPPPEDQKPKIADDFSMFDKEGSGAITKDMLKRVLAENEVQISDDEVNALFKELDVEKKGTIDILDLQRAFSKK